MASLAGDERSQGVVLRAVGGVVGGFLGYLGGTALLAGRTVSGALLLGLCALLAIVWIKRYGLVNLPETE